MQNKTLRVVLAALVVMALVCCAYAAPAAKPAAAKKFDQKKVLEDMWKAPDSTVVGTVNGVSVTKGELLKDMWFWNAPTTVTDILNQKMIEQAATKAGVKLTPAELQAKIQESLKRMSMPNVDALLNQYRVTYQRFISGTKMSALAEKTVQKQVKVTDAEYAEWLKARHILIRFPAEEKDQAKKEEIAKKKADEVYAKVKAGEDFAKLADEFSEDPSNAKPDGTKQGGDLGWFSKGRMVQEFEKKAFEMKAGEISEPVKTFYGYHIIRVDKIGKDASPAEKVELNKQILERKIPMEMGKWFQELQAKAKIDNKLAGPPSKEPTPAMRRQPMRVTPPAGMAPRPGAPNTQAPRPAPAPPAEKPAAPPAGEKPEAPPPPPPPAP